MENNSEITNVELEKSKLIISKITDCYYKKMVGQTRLGWSLLIAIISNGHILLESVPGLAKTTAAKTLTDAVNGKFSRIQCTPDLLPSDIIGTQIFNYTTNTFETKLGPVYANFVLLDEINRSSAKTQSAMLEVMQEHQTTIGGYNYEMPKIFTDVCGAEYEKLKALAAKVFVANTKKQLRYMRPADFTNATEDDFVRNFYEPLRSGRVPGETLDMQIMYPLSVKADEDEWKRSGLTGVVDYMLSQLS